MTRSTIAQCYLCPKFVRTYVCALVEGVATGVYHEVLHSRSDTVCVDPLPNVAEKDNDMTLRRMHKGSHYSFLFPVPIA